MRFLICALCAGLLASAHARTFTSANGSDKIHGDFVSYDAESGKVTLNKERGGRITTSAEHFSEEDRQYFIEAQKKVDLGRSLKLRVLQKGEGDRDDVRGIYTFEVEAFDFSFEVRNASQSSFEDLTLKYWIVVERDKSETKKPEVLKGSQTIGALEGGAKQLVDGPEVHLTLACSTDQSCPTCKAHAASFGRDRLVGTRVELVDSSGQVIAVETSSSKIDKIMREAMIEELKTR